MTAFGLPDILHARNNQVAFGANRTSDGKRRQLAPSKMTKLGHRPAA